jgi:ATP-dependent 26S proteasome regulatory subunit
LKFTVLIGEAGVPVAEQDQKHKKAQEMKGTEGESDEDEDPEGAITREVDRGVINALTKIELTAPPSKFMTVRPEEKKAGAGMLNPKFKFSDMGIGGLDAEFGMIFRRSFASRLFPPEITKKLGIRHVKGMLLYGPPGTGQ